MKHVSKTFLWTAIAAAALALTACGGPSTSTTDAGAKDAGGTGDGSCVMQEDCVGGDVGLMDCVNYKCVPFCRTKEDCAIGKRGAAFDLPECDVGLGCQCDNFSCVAQLCSADVDCGTTNVCRSGKCVASPEASTVASCQITPDVVVVKAGAKVTFNVSAWDATKAPVIVKAGATWSAVGAALTLTSGATGNTATYTGAAATSGTAPADSAQASFGSVTCKAKVIVVPSTVPAGKVDVVVVDELSGRPIEAAKVVVSQPDGTAVDQGGAAFLSTDAKGFVELSIGSPALTKYTVSAFHADYSYLTIANYEPGTGPDAGTLLIAVRRNQVDKFGGYKGTFKNVPVGSDVHAALAGMSLPGSITDLNIQQLLGPSVKKDIVIGSSINQKDVPIPAGVYLTFGENMIKPDISGQGLAGTCVDSSGAPDEAKIKDGTCGTRTAWALAGNVPIATIADLASSVGAGGGGTSQIDIASILSRITPLFKNFNSSIVRDVQFDLAATPGASTGKPDFSNTAGFAKADHDFQQVPLAFAFAVKVGELPKFKKTYADGAIIIGGANMLGRGVVPLGIGVGVNNKPADDGILDKQDPMPANGLVPVRMAPTHHGIEGADYGMVIGAVSAKALTDASAGLAMSALFARVPGNKLVFDPKGATPMDVSGQAFPAFVEGAKYNYTDTDRNGIAARTVRLPAVPANVAIVRASFTDDLGRHWDVVADSASVTTGFRLPVPPAPLADRTFAMGLASTGRAGLIMQGMRLAADATAASPTALTFKNLVEFNDANLDSVTHHLTAFSVVDYATPSVSITDPKEGTATVAKSYKFVVQVGHFGIGTTAEDDGVVRLSVKDSAGAAITGCDDMVLDTETTKGNGTLEKTLPAACAGTGLKVTATLLDTGKVAPIEPQISTQITLTIQ